MADSLPIELALQGGGAHGAYTWGVLDRLLEEPKKKEDGTEQASVEIVSISAASAGAMNAAVLASAHAKAGGGAKGRAAARKALEKFWKEVADLARLDARDVYPALGGFLFGPPAEGKNPFFDFGLAAMRANAKLVGQFVPPSVAWPWNIDPLRRLVEQLVDPAALRLPYAIRLHIATTNVRTSEMRVFESCDVTPDVVLASACLPKVFAPVKIGDDHYWDGGYLGNPPLLPLIVNSTPRDLLIVQLNPTERPLPFSVDEIEGRLNEINFNAPLLKEMAWIRAMTEAVHALPTGTPIGNPVLQALKDLLLHRIEAKNDVFELGADTKENPTWDGLQKRRDRGREDTNAWLDTHGPSLGKRSTIDWTPTEARLGCALA